jgi:ribose-phosphate pyrophosphokinase
MFEEQYRPTINLHKNLPRPPEANNHENEIIFPRPFAILTGTSNEPLAEQVARELGKTSYSSVPQYFADGEPKIQLPGNVRGHNVYVVHPTSPSYEDHSVSDHLQELIGIIDAAKRASAREITAVIPYFGFSRMDRKDQPRVPIMAARAARQIQNSGADRIIVIDIHSEQQQGFVDIPVDILYARKVLIPEIKKENLKNLVVVSPDIGGTRRAADYRDRLQADDVATLYKRRDPSKPNKSEVDRLMGDVSGKNVIIVDDIIDTAGTLTKGAQYLRERCGAKRILAASTHGLFSNDALQKIAESPIERIFVTDTIKPRNEVFSHPKITTVSVATLIIDAIQSTQHGQSLSELMK